MTKALNDYRLSASSRFNGKSLKGTVQAKAC